MNKKEREAIIEEITKQTKKRDILRQYIKENKMNTDILDVCKGQSIEILEEIRFLRELLKGVK